MPRIPYPDPKTLSPVQLERWNGALNVQKMTAHIPDNLLEGYGSLTRAVLKDVTLAPQIREMVIVRVGHLSNAPYEIHQHEQFSRKIGVPEEKIRALKDDPTSRLFSDKERVALEFTDEVVKHVRPTDDMLKKVLEHFSTGEMFALIVVIGAYMLVCRLLEASGVELDPEGRVFDPTILR